MKSKKKILSLFFSICVLSALMFQSVHTYSHLVSDFLTAEAHATKKNQLANHHPDDCQICHFTFSAFTPTSSDVIVFYSSKTYPKLNTSYRKVYVDVLFDFILLRGPPCLS